MRSKDSKFIGHVACLACNSSDALALYEEHDGNTTGFCYSCKTYFPDPLSSGADKTKIVKAATFQKKHSRWIEDLNSGDLGYAPEEIASKYGVKVEYSRDTREPVAHYYPVYRSGNLSGYKERKLPKSFSAWGDCKESFLFGQHLFNPGGKLLIICEGEKDTLAAAAMLKDRGKSYSVVGTAGGGISSIKNNLEYINSFESVILFFDQDSVGKADAVEAAKRLPPGKAKIASFSGYKDVAELRENRKNNEFWQALVSAKEWRPDGIVRLSQTWDEMWKDDSKKSILYPWKGLNDKLYGMRPGELITITSGSGMGKSALIRELSWHLFNETEDNIGILALEENIGRTSWGLVSMAANKPLHIREERDEVGQETIKSAWERSIGTGRFCAYDHFGSTSSDNLLNQVRYLIQGMDSKWIFLDHLSIVVSSMEEGGDERRTIDDIMTRLRMLVEETGAGLVLVSHLRRSSGDKGHERGSEVSLSQLRGSHSIAQLSDAVIGMERNQQADDERLQNLTKLVVLKNRYSGYTGAATHVWYSRETGRLYEIPDVDGWLLDEVQPEELKH